MVAAVAVTASLLAAACTLEAPVTVEPVDISTTNFATALGVNLAQMTKTPSGLYYQDVPAGSGTTAVSGNRVTVHYTGFLTSGSTFDSSVGKTPFSFTIGRGEVIAGWDEGIQGMKVGGTRKLVIPPTLGYGAAGAGAIPSNAILVFNVQLLSIP